MPLNILDVNDKKNTIRVLMVEDDEDDYVLTRTLVSTRENANIRLDWIDNYEEAVEVVGRNEYDVYLIDYRLGENTGIDLIQRAVRAGCRAPMILLTGQDDLAIDRSALELGAADYLVKGRIDAQLLGRSIRYALKQAAVMNELSEKENKYRSLFERSIDAIFVADSDLTILDANPSVEQLLGYSRDELKGINPVRLFASPNDFRKLRFHVREFDQVKDFEIVLISKSAKKRDCLLSVWAVEDGNSQAQWYQGIIRDVTEQKKAQQELIMGEKLTMTGKIARSIAHEVRNPLTNLSLALDQLKDELPVDNDYINMFTDIIGRNVDRIGQLVTEMLNSSKPRELDRRPQDINLAVRDTLKLVNDRLKLKSMKLVTDFQEENCIASIDREQVKIALINILINAVEAMEPEKGILMVKTCSTDDDKVCICIKDNGSGINDENRKRLFDPFFTGKAAGMGLGLTATQSIVASHRGTIEVESQVGQGTCFKILFPVNS